MRKFKGKATRDNDVDKVQYARHLDPKVIQSFGEYMHKNRKTADGMREPDNWKDGIPTQAYMDSMWRHMHAVWTKHEYGGEQIEDLNGLLFNVMGYMHALLSRKK